MFRRKEEGLFDAENDQNEDQNESAQDDDSSSQSTPTSFNTSGSSSATAVAQPSARANTSPPTANSFRPAVNTAPQKADLTRNRLPEAKPATSVTASFATPLPISADKAKGGKRVLTVGNDILLKGEIATCDRLVIEGKVDATLNDVHTVEIAECGSFKGSAQIEDAEISGLFEGDLVVRGRLVIYSTGKVRGKISYGEIEIERGGELTGEIKMTGASAQVARPTAARNNATKDDRVAA
jgi:cytoskeletal protein CcmA (bactofilin family)